MLYISKIVSLQKLSFYKFKLTLLTIALSLLISITNVLANGTGSIQIEPTSGEAPLTVSFNVPIDDIPQPLLNTTWKPGDGNQFIDINFIQYTYVNPGEYYPTYSFTDANGTLWEFSTQTPITVIEVSKLEVSLSASVTQGEAPCEIAFSAQALNGLPPYTYLWNFGDEKSIQTVDTNSHRHTYFTEGTYSASVTVTDTTGQSASSDPITISITQALYLRLDVEHTKGFEPLTTTFLVTVASGTAPYTYSYDFGDGTAPLVQTTDDAWKAEHTYTTTGSYIATILVTDNTGISKEKTVSITVAQSEDITTINEELKKVSQNIETASTLEDLSTIMSQASDLAALSLEYAYNAPEETQSLVKKNTIQEADNILTGLDTKIASITRDSTVESQEVTPILENTGDMLSSMTGNDLPITEEMLSTANSISNQALTTEFDEVLNPKTKSVSAENIENAVEISQISVGPQRTTPKDLVNQIAKPTGLTDEEIDTLHLSFAPVIDVDKDILEKQDQTTINGLNLLIDIMAQNQTKSIRTLNTKSDTAQGTGVYLLSGAVNIVFDDNQRQVVTLNNLSIVPSAIPAGMHELPDGTKLGVDSNFALHIIPASVDPVSLATYITTAGLKPKFTEDGRFIAYDEQNHSFFVMGMGWDINTSNSFQAGTVSFDISGSDPASSAYSMLIRYGDGSTQMAPPMIMAQESLLAMLENVMPGQYQLDRDTGILDLNSVKYKPDYAFEPVSDIDYQGIQNSGGVVIGDLAFEIADYNHDSNMDLLYYSPEPKGRQILFLVSN